jgi:hypothetical protein
MGKIKSLIATTKAPTELGLYSAAEELILNARQPIQSGSDWRRYLTKRGVKKAELDAFNLTETLGNKRVTQDELLATIEENRLHLKEREFRSPDDMPISWVVTPVPIEKVWGGEYLRGQIDDTLDYLSLEEAQIIGEEVMEKLVRQDSKISDYVLPIHQGGELLSDQFNTTPLLARLDEIFLMEDSLTPEGEFQSPLASWAEEIQDDLIPPNYQSPGQEEIMSLEDFHDNNTIDAWIDSGYRDSATMINRFARDIASFPRAERKPARDLLKELKKLDAAGERSVEIKRLAQEGILISEAILTDVSKAFRAKVRTAVKAEYKDAPFVRNALEFDGKETGFFLEGRDGIGFTGNYPADPSGRVPAPDELGYDLNEAQVQLQQEFMERSTEFQSSYGGIDAWEEYTLPGGTNYQSFQIYFDPEKAGLKFDEGHTGPGNEIFHVRTKDRKGPNGEKVLYVEEVQSDWGQKGHQEGWIDKKARAEGEAELEGWYSQLDQPNRPNPSSSESVIIDRDALNHVYSRWANAVGGPSRRPAIEVMGEESGYPLLIQPNSHLNSIAMGSADSGNIAEPLHRLMNISASRSPLNAYGNMVHAVREYSDQRPQAIHSTAINIFANDTPYAPIRISDALSDSEKEALLRRTARAGRLDERSPPEGSSEAYREERESGKLKYLNSDLVQDANDRSLVDTIKQKIEDAKILMDAGYSLEDVRRLITQGPFGHLPTSGGAAMRRREVEAFRSDGVSRVDTIIQRWENAQTTGVPTGTPIEISRQPDFVEVATNLDSRLTDAVMSAIEKVDYDIFPNALAQIGFAPDTFQRYAEITERLRPAVAKARQLDRLEPAPFVGKSEDWNNLAMKRIFTRAAEKDYDVVAFAPTEAHTDRWTSESYRKGLETQYNIHVPSAIKKVTGEKPTETMMVEGYESPMIRIGGPLKSKLKADKGFFAIPAGVGIAGLAATHTPEAQAQAVRADTLSGKFTSKPEGGGVADVLGQLVSEGLSMNEAIRQVGLDAGGAMLGPIAGGVAGLGEYQKWGSSAEDIAKAREGATEFFNYEPTSERAQQMSKAGQEGIGGLIGGLANYAMDPANVHDQRGVNLLPFAAQHIGVPLYEAGSYLYDQLNPREKEAVLSAGDVWF